MFARAFSLALCFCAALVPVPGARADTGTNQPQDLTDLPLESLMELSVPKVFSASKFEQKATAAPSSTTVITADEIKRQGYRTLADVLESVQGFDVAYDRNYAFLGARGVNLGDFNSRFLLLVNGHRVNNDLNDGAYIDTAFILDIDLIDRVEIIRGPSAVLYGNNAFFGVINVITRTAKQVNGAEAAGSYGSYDSYSGRGTVGWQFTNGLQVLLSGTYFNSDGPENLFYPEFNSPAQNNGVAHRRDDDGSGSFFGSASYKDFTLEGAYIEREKGNPTAQYATTFNDPRLRTIDDRSYLTAKYAHKFDAGWDVSANVYYDRNEFRIDYPVAPTLFEERQAGEWAGGELQVNKRVWDRHVLTFGAEYRDDFQQSRRVYEPATGTVFTDVQTARRSYGIYGQADIELLTNVHLNAGLRLDRYGHFEPAVDPRVALIYNPLPESTFKLIYGTAFRDPNFLELSDPRFQDIHPEKITSYELVYEQGIDQNLRSSLSGYYNRMDDLIDFENGSFTNFNADTLGLEAALEGKWKNGIRARVSYSLQHTQDRDSTAGLPDSPRHLIKFNGSVPLYAQKIFAGVEADYTSKAHTVFTDLSGNTLTGADAPEHVVVNVTLFSENLFKHVEMSAGVYNIFGSAYFDPASRFHQQALIQQDGRTYRVKLVCKF